MVDHWIIEHRQIATLWPVSVHVCVCVSLCPCVCVHVLDTQYDQLAKAQGMEFMPFVGRKQNISNTEKSMEWCRLEKSSKREAGKAIAAPWIRRWCRIVIVTILLMVFVMTVVEVWAFARATGVIYFALMSCTCQEQDIVETERVNEKINNFAMVITHNLHWCSDDNSSIWVIVVILLARSSNKEGCLIHSKTSQYLQLIPIWWMQSQFWNNFPLLLLFNFHKVRQFYSPSDSTSYASDISRKRRFASSKFSGFLSGCHFNANFLYL